MIIYIASDHAGFELKENLKKYLEELKYEVRDFGAFQYEPEDDYPDFIIPAIEALESSIVKHQVSNTNNNRGIIFGGSGQGEAMIANRFKNIRAVVCDDDKDLENKVKVWREHNDSNVLSFGARFIDEKSALGVVKLWLETPFTGEKRHVRRLNKIKNFIN